MGTPPRRKWGAANQVAGTAADGSEAVARVKELWPDVVILDVAMPRVDGLTALDRIMKECPTPVVVLSGLDSRLGPLALECLERGAVDFIAKPSGQISSDIATLGEDLIVRLKLAAQVNLRRSAEAAAAAVACPTAIGRRARIQAVILGASTGGLQTLPGIVAGWPADLDAAVLIVQHLAAEFAGFLADRLQRICPLPVTVARPGDPLRPGRILVAPCAGAVGLERNGGPPRVRLGEPSDSASRPPRPPPRRSTRPCKRPRGFTVRRRWACS